MRQQSYTFIYNWPTYVASRAPVDRRENGSLDRADGAAADLWDRRATWTREWKNGSEPRECERCAREKSRCNSLAARELRRSEERPDGQTDGRTALLRKNSFSFCGRVDPRDRCERGATGTRERPGESTIPDVQWTFQ